jgi:hypothetical protein
MPYQQQVVQPPQLPKIFSSELDAASAIEAVLTGITVANNVKAERINVIQMFCEPQSLAWQYCNDKLVELASASGANPMGF